MEYIKEQQNYDKDLKVKVKETILLGNL